MKAEGKKIVICGGTRTPFGHFSRSLAGFTATELMTMAVENTIKKIGLPKGEVDGLYAGWVGQDFGAPNLARVVLLGTGLPERANAVTAQNNCVSSMETVAQAARSILTGEGDLYIAGGVECMSRMPYTITGSRAEKALRSLQTVTDHWADIPNTEGVSLSDALEKGLTDPIKKINMAATAEVCAQIYGVTREAQDAYAHESFKRTIDGWNNGFYKDHVVPVQRGDVSLEKDEYPFLREDLVAKPQKFAKAPVAFDNRAYSIEQFYKDNSEFMNGKVYEEGAKGTVTLFNACGRSDGAAAVVVTTEERAKALDLPIEAELKSWHFHGNNPAHMGVSPALSTPVALEKAGIKFEDLDQIELHEPFAATVLGIFHLGKEKFDCDWDAKYKSGALNPNGGSLALGHPLGATGTRLLLNVMSSLKANKGRYGLIASCAGGGIGASIVVERAG